MDSNLLVEEKWQKRWDDAKLFQPEVSETKKYFLTIPYPYASGPAHIGHGRTFTTVDVIARLKRMQGFNVLFPLGIHISGTPILAISLKVRQKDEATLKLMQEYIQIYEKDEKKVSAILASFEKPEEVASFFADKLVTDFTLMGYSLDWSKRFTTGDKEYNKFVEWQFLKYEEKGVLKKGNYPIEYCLNDKNAVGEDDIKDGDTNPVEVQKFTAVKFQLETGEILLACTLRSETIFGVTNLFVNPIAKYSRIKLENKEVQIVATDSLEKLEKQGIKFEKISELTGSELIGKNVTSPLEKRSIPIFPAEFVETGTCTGVVMSVPSSAPFDFVALQDLRADKNLEKKYGPNVKRSVDSISPISIVTLPSGENILAKTVSERMKIANLKEKGKLEKATQEVYKEEFYSGRLNENCKEFAGKGVRTAKDEVATTLVKSGKAFEFFELNRDTQCRCGGKVIAAVLSGQWFIDFNAGNWKSEARECLKSMHIVPELYRKQFEDTIEWLDKRPCARRRGLGTALPFDKEWIIESLSDSTLYMVFYTIIQKIREYGIKSEQLTPEFFDFVFLGKYHASIAVEQGKLNELRREFLYWYPMDQRHTMIAHINNHLTFMIFAHAAILPKQLWPKMISLNEALLREGVKMSKSKGNVLTLQDIKAKYGVDLFRIYAIGQADLATPVDFKEKEVESMRRSLNKFVSTIENLIEIAPFDGKKPNSSISKWFLSKFNRSIADAENFGNDLKFRDFLQKAFFENLNNFDYFSRRASEEDRQNIASKIVEKWILMLCPIIPHTCEELYEKLKNKTKQSHSFASVSLFPKSQLELIDKNAEDEEDFLQGVLEDLRKLIQLVSKRGKVESAKIISASKNKWDDARKLLENDAPEGIETGDKLLQEFLKKNFYAFKQSFNFVDEVKILNEAKGFLEKELKISITIEKEEESREEKRVKAMPFKPALSLS